MKQKAKFWILVLVLAALCSACSTDNDSAQEQGEATVPPPQVRVELLPTATELPPLPTETLPAPTVEPTPAQVFFWPTPNVEELANQIEAQMDEIDNKLKSQNTNIKP